MAPFEEPEASLLEPARVAALNRAAWDRWSDTYQGRHGWLLAGEKAEAWGLWRAPESELEVLGEVEGRDVLELGCGAAHWSAALAERGARVVGVDPSAAQIRHAMTAHGERASLTLVEGGAESLPFAAESFDIVFSDYGGMSWGDPELTVPEVARVLRPGGLLAFCTTSPLFFLFLDPGSGELRDTLQRPYFGMRVRSVRGEAFDFQIPFSEWVRLFGAHGLVVEDLIEVKPPADAATTFRDRPLEWARRWPVENIWRARRQEQG
jgi:SAM-dependent methyltransferase